MIAMKATGSVVQLIERQKKFEENMVKAVEALESKVHSEGARLLLAELRLDSTKHAQICSEILSVASNVRPDRLWEARIESFVDMQIVRKELEMHIKLEETMLKDVEEVIATTKDEAIKTLFTHIAEDERKHHKNIRLVLDRSYALAP
jgi:rubrerythrin